MGHFRQEYDLSRNALLATVLAVTLVVFVMGTVWGYGILMRRLDALAAIGPKDLPAEANGVEVGRVIHWTFDAAGDWPALQRAREQRLASYGWVDRRRGRIHIPIARAMELVVKEHAQ